MFLSNLVNVLSDLYPHSSDVERLGDGAGIPLRHVSLDGTPVGMWYSLLEEAERRGKLMALISVVRDDYPAHAGLMSAAWTYMEDRSSMMRGVKAEGGSDEGGRERILKLEMEIRYMWRLGWLLLGLHSLGVIHSWIERLL